MYFCIMVDVMNTEIGQVLKRVKVLKDAIAWIKAIDTDEKRIIIDHIHEQLRSGEDGNGETMGYYSEFTALITSDFKPPKKKIAGTAYTLEYTGEFYRSMFIKVALDSILIDGDDKKVNENTNEVTYLFKWLGNDIVKLNDENMGYFAKRLTIKYIKYVREVLQIN